MRFGFFIMHLFEASGDIGSSHLCLWSNSLHLFQDRVIFLQSGRCFIIISTEGALKRPKTYDKSYHE